MAAPHLSPLEFDVISDEMAEILEASGLDKKSALPTAYALLKVLAEYSLVSRPSYNTFVNDFIGYASASGYPATTFDHLVLKANLIDPA
jgi:hypothetical protein